jgi:uncharacterized protein (TIGR02145 family)
MKNSYHFFIVLFILGFTNPLYSQSVPSYVPTNGLVGWWGFNGNAQDGSGNGNHGTVNGATLTTDRFGNQNGAYSFDGATNSISIPHSNSIAITSNITISVWKKSNGNTGNYESFVNKRGGNGEWNYNLSASHYFGPGGCPQEVDKYVSARRNNGGAQYELKYTDYLVSNDLNNWTNVIVSINSDTVKFFINGNLVGNSCYGNIFTIPSIDVQAPLTFGSCNCGLAEWFHGTMDDIGIWNRALNQHEITNLYNAQPPTQTSLCLPTITTNTPTSIGIDSVLIGGDILNDGGSSIVLRGVCYSTTPNPNMGNTRTEDGSGIGSFSTILRNLNPSTTYYVRSYAKNSQGVVVYGNEVNFSTATNTPFACGSSTVSDIDGNVYNTVQIGNQCWTQSNLKVSRYRNGNSIPTGLSNSDWQNATSGAYAVYDNDPVNDGLYGKLYNHFTVTDSRGLCPTGWHVPTDGEWTTLETFLGGSIVAGGALKSTVTQPTPGGWNSPNTGATNSSGFTAGPGGLRDNLGGFLVVGSLGYWWSSSLSGTYAWNRRLYYDDGDVLRNDNSRTDGFSVRCLRD